MTTDGSQLPAEIVRFVRAAPLHRGAIVRELHAFATSLPAGTRVLDAGAGEAPYRNLFGHCSYTTHDWAESPHPGARGADLVADLVDLPVPDGVFDAALLTEVLEHVPEPVRALGELARVLRPHGQLFMTVPFVGELHEEPYDFYRYTSHGIRHLLSAAGFEQIAVVPLTGWYSTLSHVLRHAGLATRAPQGSSRSTRGPAFAALIASDLLRRLAPRLDRLDERRALPIGWAATALRPSHDAATT